MKSLTFASLFAVALAGAGCNQNTDQSGMPAATNSPAVYTTNSTAAVNTNGIAGGASADNTKINARDQNNSNPTPLDQGNSDSDIQMSASIRKLVVSSTNDFSTEAKNIKIITQNGKVTLRGPVNSDAEKTQIGGIARGVAGDGNVANELEVKTN